MATPLVVQPTGTDVTAATTWAQFFAFPGKHAVKGVYARVRYTGTLWEVHASSDSQELQSANLAWSTDHLNIAISGFTVAPRCQVTPIRTASGILLPAALSASDSQGQVYWHDAAFTLVTSQSALMDADVLIYGT